MILMAATGFPFSLGTRVASSHGANGPRDSQYSGFASEDVILHPHLWGEAHKDSAPLGRTPHPIGNLPMGRFERILGGFPVHNPGFLRVP